MVKLRSRIFLSVFTMMLSVFVYAQDSLKNERPQMADALRSSGKIYVVVVVLSLF
jgi:hypothetical protein